MSKTVIFSLVLCLFASISSANQETLVLLDNLAIRETHSIFFKSLSGKLCTKISTGFVFIVVSFNDYLTYRSRFFSKLQVCRWFQPFVVQIWTVHVPKRDCIRTVGRRIRRIAECGSLDQICWWWRLYSLSIASKVFELIVDIVYQEIFWLLAVSTRETYYVKYLPIAGLKSTKKVQQSLIIWIMMFTTRER